MTGSQIANLTKSYATGGPDPVEICEAALERGSRLPESGVFITVTHARALREAAASAARYRAGTPLGPLDGVPVVIKDMIDVAGTRTTLGSVTRRDAPAAHADAAVVANLAAAGAVVLGKSVLSELAFSGLGLNAHFGNVHNPRPGDVARIPGGSSSGSAVAVAAGVAPVALGTDTSGSVRVPAAFCEIAGFKASEGRYDMAGVWPLAATLDSLGVFAHDVTDLAVADAAMCGVSPRTPTAADPTGVRIVVPVGELVEDCAPDTARAFSEAIGRLADAGVEVTERRVRTLDEARELMMRCGTVVVAEARQLHGHLLASHDVEIDPLVLRRLRSYDSISDRVHEVFQRRRELREQIAAELDGAVLAYPTVCDSAPALAPLLEDLDLAEATNQRVLRGTMLTSYLGMPGITLPTRPTADAATGSVLLSLPQGHDDRLLTAALALEPLLCRAPSSPTNTRPGVTEEVSRASHG